MTYLPPAERPKWQQSAACRGKPVEMFFVSAHAGVGATREAKIVCAGCPVRAECLDFGITEKFGIFGGLAEKERRDLRRQRRHGRGAA